MKSNLMSTAYDGVERNSWQLERVNVGMKQPILDVKRDLGQVYTVTGVNGNAFNNGNAKAYKKSCNFTTMISYAIKIYAFLVSRCDK